MVRATDTRRPHVQYKLHVKCGTGLNPKIVKLVRAAASNHTAKPKYTWKGSNKKINAHNSLCSNRTKHLRIEPGSDTTVGDCVIENKNFLSHAEATTKIQSRRC
jgi:hypothetical protein